MHALLAALVLAAGSLAPVQPAATAPAPAARPADQPAAQDLLEFTDASLIPAWAVKPADRNAAVGYLKAVIDFPRDAREPLGEIDWDKIGPNMDASKMPEAYSKALAAMHAGSTQWIRTCVEASTRTRCDFENSYEGGVGMLLPHLSYLRQMARGLRLEARSLAVDGKRDEAAKLVAATLRMARHASHDRILISTLVGVAIGRVGSAEAAVLLDSGPLSDQSRAELRAALAYVLTDDPFHGRASLETERDMFLEWFKIAVQKSDKAPHLVTALLGQSDRPELSQRVAALKGDKLAAEIARAREGYDEVIRAWGSDDATAKFIVLEKRVEQGEFGLIAQIAMPSFARSWKNCSETAQAFRDLDARLAAPTPAK